MLLLIYASLRNKIHFFCRASGAISYKTLNLLQICAKSRVFFQTKKNKKITLHLFIKKKSNLGRTNMFFRPHTI